MYFMGSHRSVRSCRSARNDQSSSSRNSSYCGLVAPVVGGTGAVFDCAVATTAIKLHAINKTDTRTNAGSPHGCAACSEYARWALSWAAPPSALECGAQLNLFLRVRERWNCVLRMRRRGRAVLHGVRVLDAGAIRSEVRL